MTADLNQVDPMPTPEKKRRGRPPGSKFRTIQEYALGIHHFAFLRSYFQGLDTRAAWIRYMAFAEVNSDLRHIEHRRTQLLDRILREGHQYDLTLPPEEKISGLLELLSKSPIAPSVKPIPSMNDFAESIGIDPGEWSEDELLQMYKEHYGLDRPLEPGEVEDRSSEMISKQVQALNHISMVIARKPSLSDRADLWIHSSTAALLKKVGAYDIERIMDLVNLHGFYWFKKVDGLGEVKAAAIVGWLDTIQETVGKPLRSGSKIRPGRIESGKSIAVITDQIFDIVPLEQLSVPARLQGKDGVFRTGMANNLGADTDDEAIKKWLSFRKEKQHTLRSYKKEVERFYLWCLHECGKPLSSIDSGDCQAYREFLAAIPDSWIQQPGGRRSNDDRWKPFRKQLSPASIKQAVVIVQAMFEGLNKLGYLVANPMSAVIKDFDLPASHINIDRSLTNAEWKHVMDEVRAMKDGKDKRRYLALLETLTSTGIRLDELSNSTWKDLAQVSVDGEDYKAWILKVVGKGKVKREIPVPDDVVELLRDHLKDMRLPEAGEDPKKWPLIGVLYRRVINSSSAANLAADDAPEENPVGEPLPPTEGGAIDSQLAVISPVQNPEVADQDSTSPSAPPPSPALSSSGIYALLSNLFSRLALTAPPGVEPDHLGKASTHWLRHTYGRQGAEDGVPIEVLQQALGHKDLNTTTIYLSTERSRMVKELKRVRSIRDARTRG